MKRFCNIFAVLAVVAAASSCLAKKGNSPFRSNYSIMDYSESEMGSVYLFEPVMAVVLARDADVYLALTDEEKENYDTSERFPEGLRHIDANSINIPGLASIYSDGGRFDTPGAEWTVRANPYALTMWNYSYRGSHYYEAYHYGSTTYYPVKVQVKCVSAGKWTVTSRGFDDDAMAFAEDQITVSLDSDTGESSSYTVVSAGRADEDDGLHAECGTSGDGVRLRYSMGTVESPGEESAAVMRVRMLKPYSGKFCVTFYRGNEQVDHCYITYTEDSAEYDVSVD